MACRQQATREPVLGTEVRPAGELRPYLTATLSGALEVKAAGGAQDA
jgi:hypothetical protein